MVCCGRWPALRGLLMYCSEKFMIELDRNTGLVCEVAMIFRFDADIRGDHLANG